MKKVLGLLTLLLLLVGCASDKPAASIVIGSTPEQFKKTIATQVTASKVIEKESSSIITATTNTNIITSAKNILISNQRIIVATETLEAEVKDKEKLITAYNTIKVDYDELVEDKNSGFRKFFMFLKIAGALMIPVGIFLGFRLSTEFYWVAVGGVIVVITSSIITFIEQYWIWVALLMLIGIVTMVVRQYLIQDDATLEAVKVSEILKAKVKKSDKKFIKDLFGDGTKPGTLQQSKRTEKVITAKRKQVLKKAKPTEDKV